MRGITVNLFISYYFIYCIFCLSLPPFESFFALCCSLALIICFCSLYFRFFVARVFRRICSFFFLSKFTLLTELFFFRFVFNPVSFSVDEIKTLLRKKEKHLINIIERGKLYSNAGKTYQMRGKV